MPFGSQTILAMYFGSTAVSSFGLGGDVVPFSLFSPEEVSLWLDMQDSSARFQDSAQTTPATALDSPIGGLVDKSSLGLDATASGTVRPLLKSDGDMYCARFDGTDDVLSLTGISGLNLDNKTFILVAKPTGVDNAQDAMFAWMGPSSAYIEVESRTTGQFQYRTRHFGMGLALSSIDPIDPYNVIPNRINQKDIYVLRIDSGVTTVVGRYGAVSTTISGGSRNVDQYRIGLNRLSNYMGMDFYEAVLLNATDDVSVQSAIDKLATKHSITDYPIMTPILNGDVRIFGDSISIGISSTPSNNSGFIELSCNALVADTAKSGLADARMCAVGETDPTKTDAAFHNVSNDVGIYSGMGCLIVHFGINDYRRADAPLGTISDTSATTFYGAMKVGYDNVRAQAPSIPIIFTAPFYYPTEDTVNAQGYTLQDLRNAIQAFCVANDVGYFDMSSIGINADNSTTYLADGLHPNDAGHQLGRDFFLPYLVSYLRS